MEKMVEVRTDDGVMPAFVIHSDKGAPLPAVIFYMDVFGLRDELKEMCRRIAAAGYYVMLPGLYYRAGNPAYDPADFAPSGVSPVDKKSALHPMALNNATTNGLVIEDTGALLRFLATEPLADASRVGAIGTCMGGRHALFAATEYPDRVLACASLHGGRMVTDADDSPHLALARLQGEAYFGWADQDRAAPAEHLEIYRAEVERLGLNANIDFIPGADHGYSFPTRSHAYNQAAAERSWRFVLDLFERQLKTR